ncbi:unnamed protein product [Prorocentrum cordatum]|uniref:Subtilisin n=1 Tax=Prorocentrum cordatum TaxID=2364126 RepID=A0ABN9PJ82_9DINO|nr:unnamed protein product [Polarella glacialis]
MASFRGAIVVLLWLPIASSLQTALEADPGPRQVLVSRAAEARAASKVATERAAESESHIGVAGQGVEDPNCPQWCFISHQYWHVKCTYSHCANCAMCGPYDHDRKEAALETEQQQLLGGRSAASSRLMWLSRTRARRTRIAHSGASSATSIGTSSARTRTARTARCAARTTTTARRLPWRPSSSSSSAGAPGASSATSIGTSSARTRTARTARCAARTTTTARRLPWRPSSSSSSAGGSAGSSAVAEVATKRAAASNVAVADHGSEDPNCPQWCFISHQYWHVKCTYSHCANCAMCGPYDHDRKEAAAETEQQQLLGGRSGGSSAVEEVVTERAAESNVAVADQGSEGSAGSSAVAEVATERAAESNVAVADQGSEDPNCPQWCFISHQYWHVKCTYSHCANCAMCGPYDHDRKEAAAETEQQQLLGGRSAGSSTVVEVATERAAESDPAVANQGSEDSAGSPAVVDVATGRAAESNVAVADQGSEGSAGSSAVVEVATERPAERVADQDDPEGVMAALEQNGV